MEIETLLQNTGILPLLIENIKEGLVIYHAIDDGMDFIIKLINRSVETIEKVDRKQVIGRKVTEVFPGITQLGLLEKIRQVYHTGKPETLPNALYQDHRITGWRENRIYPLENKDILVLYQDKSVETGLIEDMKMLAKFPEENPNPVLRITASGEIIYRNRASLILLEHWDLLKNPEKAQELKLKMESFYRNNEISTMEIEIEKRVYLINIVPIKNANYLNIYGIDITQKKRYELYFNHHQKMDAVARMAGGMAHEFNNILTIILGFSSIIYDEGGLSDQYKEKQFEVIKAGKMAQKIIEELTTFSKNQIVQYVDISLNQEIETFLKLLKNVIPVNIQIKTVFQAELWPVYGDPTQIQQVLMNLILNARDAMLNGGTIQIETQNVEITSEQKKLYFDFAQSKYVCLSISDSGIGMNKETLSQIFEPFFTTKGKRGTGLGLSIIYGIIEQMGGLIHVYSEVGKGTTFKVYFKPPENVQLIPQLINPKSKALKINRMILVIEDDVNVRNYIKIILTKNNLIPIEASNGTEGINQVQNNPHNISLIISDVILPDMNAHQIIQQLNNAGYQIDVLYISGYTANVIHHNGMLNPGVNFLSKPFSPQELIQKIIEIQSKEKVE